MSTYNQLSYYRTDDHFLLYTVIFPTGSFILTPQFLHEGELSGKFYKVFAPYFPKDNDSMNTYIEWLGSL